MLQRWWQSLLNRTRSAASAQAALETPSGTVIPVSRAGQWLLLTLGLALAWVVAMTSANRR